MTDLPIYDAAKKRLNYGEDVDYYLSILFSYPENEWFSPNDGDEGRDHQGFTICDYLYSRHIIACQSCPIWNNSSFLGIQRQFFYNKNMDFKPNK